VGPRVGLDTVVRREISNPCRDSNPLSYSPWSNAIPLSYPDSEMDVYWIHLAQGRVEWRSLVNTVMVLWVP